jgi:ankyrin repeat protein
METTLTQADTALPLPVPARLLPGQPSQQLAPSRLLQIPSRLLQRISKSLNSLYSVQYGDTPLHTSARYGHAGVIRILVSAKCNASEQNKVRNEVIEKRYIFVKGTV